MRRFNTYDLYQLGSTVHPLAELRDDTPLNVSFWPILNARFPLEALLSNRMIQAVYCRSAGERLLNAIIPVIDPIFQQTTQQGAQQSEPQNAQPVDWNAPIPLPQTFEIRNATQVFENVLAAELQQQDTYLVWPKGIYSTTELIERTENHFPERVRVSLPQEAIRDIREAGRCLAFEVPTAAGLHILRAVESVIVRYMAAVGTPPVKPNQKNWGVYLEKLRQAGADAKVINALDQLRDLHRNPTMHPEVFLDMDEALSLFGVAQSAITWMVVDMDRRHSGAPVAVPNHQLASTSNSSAST